MLGLIFVGTISGIVTMTLVSKQEEVKVPHLVGKDIIYALEVLSGAGLNLRISGQEYDSSFPTNSIISQKPESGTNVRKGRNVRVVLSKGSEKIVVPDIRGESWRRAEIILKRSGLEVGKITRTFSNSYLKDLIIEQDPPPLVEIARGKKMNLLISEGKREVWYYMPDVIGKKLNEILPILENTKIQVGKIDYEVYSESLEPGIIVNQSPLLGYKLKSGGQIDLVVTKRGMVEKGKAEKYVLLQYVVPWGLGAKKVKIVLENQNGISNIYHKLTKPGKEIQLLVEVSGETTVMIFVNERLVDKREY